MVLAPELSEAEVLGSSPKQSFEDRRSQTGVWERGEGVTVTTDSVAIN